MKRISVALFSLVAAAFSAEAQNVVIDSAALQAGFVNEVYYSIPSYTKIEVTSDWDIALSSQPTNIQTLDVLQAVTVRINGGRGVRVMKITNADATGFTNTFNPATDSANWTMLYDDMTNWDLGAVNTTRDPANNF